MTSWLFLLIGGLIQYAVCGSDHLVGDKHYFISTPQMANWYQANRYCMQMGMQLTNPRNQMENENIIELLRATGISPFTNFYWIGGTNLGSHGLYYWISNGDELEFDYFSERSDYTMNDACIAYRLFDLRWFSRKCNYDNYFICQSKVYF